MTNQLANQPQALYQNNENNTNSNSSKLPPIKQVKNDITKTIKEIDQILDQADILDEKICDDYNQQYIRNKIDQEIEELVSSGSGPATNVQATQAAEPIKMKNKSDEKLEKVENNSKNENQKAAGDADVLNTSGSTAKYVAILGAAALGSFVLYRTLAAKNNVKN